MIFCGFIGCLSINKMERHGASNPVKSLSTTITRSSTVNASFYVFPNFKFSVIVNLVNDIPDTFV